LPVVVFAGIVVWRLVGEQRAATERRLIQTAHMQTAAIEREMAATIRILEALAQSEPLDLEDLSAFYAEARRVQQSQPTWYNVILFSRDGRELVSVVRPNGYLLRRVTDFESFDRVVATSQPAVGRLVRGPTDGPLGIPIRVPVTRDGQLHGVLTAVITPERFSDAVFHDLPAPDESARTILDTVGTIVASTRTPDVVAGRPAARSMIERTRSGSEGVYRDTMPDGRRVCGDGKGGWGVGRPEANGRPGLSHVRRDERRFEARGRAAHLGPIRTLRAAPSTEDAAPARRSARRPQRRV